MPALCYMLMYREYDDDYYYSNTLGMGSVGYGPSLNEKVNFGHIAAVDTT